MGLDCCIISQYIADKEFVLRKRSVPFPLSSYLEGLTLTVCMILQLEVK